jgi:ATP-dependent RNA helicase MRH4, mitochondrial
MPRPTRSRTAAQAKNQSTNASDSHDEQEIRGRSRTTRSRGLQLGMSEKEALKAANQSRDAALDKLASSDLATSTADDNTQESLEIGRRDATVSPAALRRDTTGLDLADSVVLDLDESFEDLDIPVGGRSADNSSYHLSHIKPRSRSRQSSIVGRNDPPIRPSSRSGMTPLVSSSFNIGAFRRRAREPSILGTGRKTNPDTTTTTAQEPGSESESEDDFAPEAESTPVNRRRTRQSLRNQEQDEASPLVQEASSSRKRKSDVVPAEEDARPSKISRSDDSASVQGSDSDSELSSLPSPQVMALAVERPVTPTNFYNEEDAASPVSSTMEGNDAWPDIRNLAKRRRRPSVSDPMNLESISNISSPPSLTHSPNYNEEKTARRGRARTQRHQSPTTADLANLLPKRRHQRMRSPAEGESDEELDADGLGRDDDELYHLDASRRRGQKSRSVSRATTRSTRRAQPALAEKDTPAMNTRKPSRHSATYSRRASDKENQVGSDDEEDEDENEASRFEPMPEDSFTGETGDASRLSTSNELSQAKAKFKEVDRWELEYEEASEPPSPVGAR